MVRSIIVTTVTARPTPVRGSVLLCVVRTYIPASGGAACRVPARRGCRVVRVAGGHPRTIDDRRRRLRGDGRPVVVVMVRNTRSPAVGARAGDRGSRVPAGDDVAHVETAPGQAGQVAVVEGEIIGAGHRVDVCCVCVVLSFALGAVLLVACFFSYFYFFCVLRMDNKKGDQRKTY